MNNQLRRRQKVLLLTNSRDISRKKDLYISVEEKEKRSSSKGRKKRERGREGRMEREGGREREREKQKSRYDGTDPNLAAWEVEVE